MYNHSIVMQKGFFCFMQQYTRKEAVDKLLESYRGYYNIVLFEKEQKPLTALCEFFEHTEKYVLTRSANLWSAEREEFLYLIETEHLTKEIFEKYRDYALEDGMKRAHIGPGHMSTYITPVFICDTCEEETKKAVKNCRIYKSFHFSLHGWMDFHTAVLELSNKNKITTNSNGKCVGKILKNVLFQKEKKRRRFL